MSKVTIDGTTQFDPLDKKNVDETSDYNKLVLRLTDSLNINESQGSIIGYITNLYVSDSDIEYTYDEEFIKITEIDNETLATSFNAGFNTSKLEFKKLLNVIGLKLGSTQITFTAKNGYTTYVEVEVVKTYETAKIDVKKSYGKDIIAQNFINDYNSENLPYQVSAKVNGSFNVVYTVNPDDSAVYGVTYTSSNPAAAKVNPTGLVETITKGQTTITVDFVYYNFESVDGYIQWVKAVDTKSFVLEVFIPATTITLNAPIFNVYDYNSLGYEYKDESIVDIDVIIYPTDASIANMQDNVTFLLSNNNNNLVGAKGTYTAFLKQNQTKATVYVTVMVVEYGVQTSLTCTVNIFKAPQIEEINIDTFEGQAAVELDYSGKDVNGHDVLYFSTKNGSRITFNTSIIPGERSVFVDDLVVVIFESNESKDFLGIDADSNFASISYKGVQGYSVVTNGQDSFYLDVDDVNIGYFYIVIFARDNMTSAITGKNYVKILIRIADGSQESPYEVKTVKDLVAISSAPEKHYILGNDLNIGSISNWTPISNFTGSLNGYNSDIKDSEGNGTYFKVSGLKINSVNSANVGLFETISNATDKFGAVMNLALEVAAINLSNYTVENVESDTINIGAIAGTNYGVIVNCSVKFNIFKVSLLNKNANIGGMVGTNGGGESAVGGLIVNFSEEYDLNSGEFGTSIAYNLEKADGSNIVQKRANYIATDRSHMVSVNPVNGNIVVSDFWVPVDEPTQIGGYGYYVLVGGIAGNNDNGQINGIYGYYNIKNEYANYARGQQVNFGYLVNFQSQGIDAKVNINYDKVSDVGSITNAKSAIGGIVGKLVSGNINNVSAEGNIGMIKDGNIVGAYNSIGGIVGNASDNSEVINKNIINVSSSVKLRGKNYVGGVVGYATLTEIEKARVEAYEQLNGDDQTLIVADNFVGGIVGIAYTVFITNSYSYSYVNDFNENYIGYGDIYSTAEDANVGGLVGFSDVRNVDQSNPVTIQSSYSTFNIYAYGKNAMVGGLVGNTIAATEKQPSLLDVAYTGVLYNDTVGIDDSTARTSWAYNIKGLESNPENYNV
ncbi:MAG: Ig-like domain-containing protein, partial [Clostridia bacterium]|nr:Ig-like domain-containing protein [Clostridia bacterium]